MLLAMIFVCLFLLPIHSREYPFRVLALSMIIGSALVLLFMEIE